jgi:hypothetical protein
MYNSQTSHFVFTHLVIGKLWIMPKEIMIVPKIIDGPTPWLSGPQPGRCYYYCGKKMLPENPRLFAREK